MWLVSSLDATANVANNIPIAMEVGVQPLQLAPLKAALITLYQRHASLRTAYIDDADGTQQADQPLQRRPVFARAVDAAAARPEVQMHDISGLYAGELTARVGACANTPFDLTCGQLLRADAFSTDGRSDVLPVGSVLLLTFHHICCDLWSLVLLFDELQQLLGGGAGNGAIVGAIAGAMSKLTVATVDEPLSYSTYARQQRGAETLDLDLARY